MNKKKAIDILKVQLSKIDDRNDETWLFQTAEYIRQFFGESSAQFSYINQFKFTVTTSFYHSNEENQHWLSQKPIEAKQFVRDCIETIDKIGIYKEPNINFISKLSDTAIWTIIPLFMTVLFSGGLLFGQYLSDVKNIEIRQELERCQKLLPLPKSNSNPKPSTPTSKTSKPNENNNSSSRH